MNHDEVLYLLFLQLSKLAVHGQHVSTVLLHAILNKSNKDIKIRKEAERQIERFERDQKQDD